jgi:hypothetical protein
MNDQPRIPDPETRKRWIERMQEICRQYDALNLILDEAIALAEADIRNSPLNVYRLEKAKRTVGLDNSKIDI